MTIAVYSSHGGQIRLPNARSLCDVLDLARAAAALGHDALYRVFGPDGFVLSFSVRQGVVRVLGTPTIPAAHWGRR